MMVALTTTWTEQSVVAFTAGTLSDQADIRAYVESKLQRGTLSASSKPTITEVNREIVRAKQALCEVFGFTWQRRYSYADTVAATYRYALPADFMGGEVRLRDMTNDRFLDWIDPFRFDLKYPDVSKESNSKPQSFTIKDRELWIVPAAGAVYRLEFEYGRTGDDSTTSDISYLPESMRFKCADFAIYQSFMILHDFPKAQIYKQEWMEGLLKGKRADNRKKWAHSGFQAMTWQQEYAAKFNQT